MSLGLIGGGGSILTVPILVYFFRTDPLIATGYSLLIVGLTSVVGASSYAKQRLLELRTGLLFGIPSVLGVSLARGMLVPNLPDPVFSIGQHSVSKGSFLMIAFSILMLAAAASMLHSSKAAGSTSENRPNSGPRNPLLVSLFGFLIGCVTGYLGAGGGFLIVPVLALLLKLPMKSAVGTSLFIIAVSSLFGFAVDLLHQREIQLGFLASVSLVSVAGIGLGAWLTKFVSNVLLKKAFAYLVLIVGCSVLVGQVRGIFGA
jgi:hypothetical protein